MKSNTVFGVALGGVAVALAPVAFAAVAVPAPAPLMAAGLPGLAILALAGGGYLAVRLRRRGRD